MQPASPIDERLLDADGRVAADLDCIECAYNLRTLAAVGDCPECGTPVRNSAGGALLRFADPEWLSNTATAACVLAGSVGVVAGVTVATLLLEWLAAPFGPSDGLVFLIAIGAVLTGMIAALTLAVPESPDSETAPDPPARGRTFFAIMTTFLLSVAMLFSASAGSIGVAIVNASLLFAFALLLLPLSLGSYLASLMRRAPRSDLAFGLLLCSRGFAACAATAFLCTVLPYAPPPLEDLPQEVCGLAASAAALGALLFFVLVFVVLLRVARALSKAAREARDLHEPPAAADEG